MVTKQKILVTGSNGQLGKELKELSASFPLFEFRFLSKENLSIHDPPAVRRVFHDYRPQYVVNCAAYTAVDKAEQEMELAFLVNGEAVGILAAASKEFHARFIHVSTDYVFDGTATVPYKEDDTTNPQSAYGASKLEGEKQAVGSDPDSIILRTSWVYSAHGNNFVKTMLRLFREKEQINVVQDQLGSPTYAADLAELILQIIASQQWQEGIYHFSNEGVTSWYDFAEFIKESSGSSCIIHPIPTSQYPTPAKRPAYSVLDKTKILQVYGIPLKNWQESLTRCLVKLNATAAR